MRSLGFNSELTLNDGLLTGSVARRDSITYEAARQRVGQCVESFIHQLRESGTVPVGRLGTLSVSPEAKGYIFEPAEDNFAANLPCLGLEPLMLAPVAEPVADEIHEHVVSRPRFRAGFMARVAASVVLLCVTFGIVIATSGLSRRTRRHGLDWECPHIQDSGRACRDLRNSRLARHSPQHCHSQARACPCRRTFGVHWTLPACCRLFPHRESRRFIGGRAGLSTIAMDGNYRIYALHSRHHRRGSREGPGALLGISFGVGVPPLTGRAPAPCHQSPLYAIHTDT